MAAVEEGVPALVEARKVVGAFQTMVRGNELGQLEGWLKRAEAGRVAFFAHGIGQDRSAVQAAITLPWSNGQTERQITKLKLVKHQMYGRSKIDLLQARLIGLNLDDLRKCVKAPLESRSGVPFRCCLTAGF